MSSKFTAKTLFERPKNVGFRFGFIAIVLIMITAVFPAFLIIGVDSPQISSFQGMFLTGLVGTMFFSFILRNMSKTTDATGLLITPQNISKQMGVLLVGVIAGIVMIIANSMIYNTTSNNIMFGSIWGTIDAQAFYLGMLAGVSEELFFRGFIGTFLRIVSPSLIFALIPSALIFSLFHYFAYQTLSAFVVLFALGLILGVVHEFTNDIGAPMLAHIINNTFAMMPMVIAILTDNVFIIVGIVVVFIVIAFGRSSFRRR